MAGWKEALPVDKSTRYLYLVDWKEAFLLPHLPPFSSPKEFPPDFPIELLPPKYQPPQATAEDLCIGLHEALQSIDPVMAGRWNWRDLRKVRRSLEVALCTGKLMSNLVAEQDQIDNRASDSQEERIPYRTLVFWLFSETEQLLPRLDARVDKMIEMGGDNPLWGVDKRTPNRTPGADWRACLHANENWRAGPHANDLQGYTLQVDVQALQVGVQAYTPKVFGV
ncbi:hypothetical protein PGTUg99_022754 [Puccinia graminis f. sp. tritici]|uniref:Uncharacterized protein n=1 Tax=Puccinia graminis f. sp. tritici TaxID=56615 RepID=A0A5B0Q3Z6_PUCGR|nr:hypothetical protein PGTUg99_022754 [Puccinia graminis f. sp. tritici]